ncbi:hypothetical protein ACFO9Q_19290 [Paenibacillus sp. GCM10023252]|uniref:hypothetical protein n=1 Tax=Paenibacillus sp. GCM10023252 TaxID=3252649 RepID=UPI0036220F5C
MIQRLISQGTAIGFLAKLLLHPAAGASVVIVYYVSLGLSLRDIFNEDERLLFIQSASIQALLYFLVYVVWCRIFNRWSETG